MVVAQTTSVRGLRAARASCSSPPRGIRSAARIYAELHLQTSDSRKVLGRSAVPLRRRLEVPPQVKVTERNWTLLLLLDDGEVVGATVGAVVVGEEEVGLADGAWDSPGRVGTLVVGASVVSGDCKHGHCFVLTRWLLMT